MKIVAVTPLYPPKSLVGSWITTHEFVRVLAERGHDVTVVASMAHGADYELDGVKVLNGLRCVEREVNAGVDVVLSHLGDRGDAHTAATAAGVPSVRMAHSIDPAAAKRLAESPCDLVIANSHATAAALGDVAPTVVARPPVDPERYRTTPGDHITLVNLSPEKGGIQFARIARSMLDTQFLGVRGGYGQQVAPGRPKNLTIIGTTPDMRDDVYARTRVLVMPSAAESWGRVGIEAMCSGIPVVAHPTAGLLEALGAAGIFIDRDDITGWVAELRRLQDPDEWAAASAAALARVDQLDPAGDVEAFVDAIESIRTGVPA